MKTIFFTGAVSSGHPAPVMHRLIMALFFIILAGISCSKMNDDLIQPDAALFEAGKLKERWPSTDALAAPANTFYTISTASVSSTSAVDPNNASPTRSYDGLLDTRFAINGLGQYVTYDLGSSKTVGSIQIAWYQGDTRAMTFQVFAGTSTTALTKVFDSSSSGTTANYQVFDFTDLSARYVRIVGQGNTVNTWMSISEIKIAAADTPDSNLSISAATVSDATKVDVANSATADKSYDNLMTTRFAINGIGQYITYDLGSSKTVGAVQIAWYVGNTRSTSFQIFAGTSTTALTKVFEGSSSGTTTNYENYNFADLSARYVRIVGLGNSSPSEWLSINEVKITGADGSGGNPVLLSPFNTIALQQRWKITLPKTEDGDNYADEVFIDASKNDYVADGSFLDYNNANYFYTDGDYAYYKCPGNGKTTSGSSNPRTEMREMNDGGATNASWSMASAYADRHVMSFSVRVMQTSESREVCFAQIHAVDEPTKVWDDIIRIQCESDVANATVGDNANINIDGSGNNEAGYKLMTNYKLGDVLNFRIEAYSQKYDVYLNGTKVYTSPRTNISWTKNYFKAGNYMQQVKSRGTGGSAIVALKNVVITHY